MPLQLPVSEAGLAAAASSQVCMAHTCWLLLPHPSLIPLLAAACHTLLTAAATPADTCLVGLSKHCLPCCLCLAPTRCYCCCLHTSSTSLLTRPCWFLHVTSTCIGSRMACCSSSTSGATSSGCYTRSSSSCGRSPKASTWLSLLLMLLLGG